MTSGAPSVLSTLGREARVVIRESLRDAVRLTVGVLLLASGLAALSVGIVEGNAIIGILGAILSLLAVTGLCLESASVSWLRERYRGRRWRWS
jgi:hypothetical protein